jgi:predicted RNA binding protein YcfA (HicA-like mRNA interferase family)
VPPKVRDLEHRLARAGFVERGAKGFHRKWWHPSGVTLVISGKKGQDAKLYQEEAVEEAIQRATKRQEG